jgi:hypothetical protein
VAGLFDSPRAAQKRWPLAYAAHDPAEYLPNPAGVSAPPSEASADEQAIRDAERRYDELIRAESDDYEREKLRFQRDSEIPRLRSRLEEKRQYGSRTKRR